tara:strand:- start:407 stop:1090 length:684 start_codon:yes stop_codon:yes gene_type:complete
MGQNSTEVAYGFGQLGSVYANVASKPVYPPKDLVIVAIQFIAANTLTELHTETLDTYGPQYPTTEGVEATDNNYLGVVEAAASGGTAAGVITIADAATNAKIKKGQIVLIAEDNDTIDAGLTVDAGAGHVTPIYNGPNRQWLEVVSLTGGTYGTTLTVKAVGACTTAALANIDVANTILFLDSYHGAGGTTTDGTSYPTGIIIYGRWTRVELGSTDADGGIICYFGE